MLSYLESTQEADGHWAQNMWLDGRPYWAGLQMDETAFPILLVDLLRRYAPDEMARPEALVEAGAARRRILSCATDR